MYKILMDRYAGSGLSSQWTLHTWYREGEKVKGILMWSNLTNRTVQPKLKEACWSFHRALAWPFAKYSACKVSLCV